MSTEIKGLWRSIGEQQRTGEQASTERDTVYRGSPAHRPLLIMEISPRPNFHFEMWLSGCVVASTFELFVAYQSVL